MVTPRGPEERRFFGRSYKPHTYVGIIIALVLVLFVVWWLILPLFFAA